MEWSLPHKILRRRQAEALYIIETEDHKEVKWQPVVTPKNTFGWAKTAPRALAGTPRRMHGNVVLLPTGEVLSVGGVKGLPDGTALDSTGLDFRGEEIYNPFSGIWSALTHPTERAQIVRNYHSVALLMPDGRVWTAGSDHDASSGIDKAELRIEIYEPWYYRLPNRPEITGAPDRGRTGEEWRWCERGRAPTRSIRTSAISWLNSSKRETTFSSSMLRPTVTSRRRACTSSTRSTARDYPRQALRSI